MMPTKAALLTVLALLSNSANAVDSAYLNSLKYKLIGINLKLPKKIDVRYFLQDRDFNKSVTGQYRTHSSENLNKRINHIKDRILALSVRA